MNCWQRLAIQPTSDLRAIKKAYAVQLKLIDLEIEPKAFIALREALQNAQLEAEYLTQHSMLKKLIDTTKHSIQPTPASQAACGLKFQIEIGALQLPQWIESQSTDLNLRDAVETDFDRIFDRDDIGVARVQLVNGRVKRGRLSRTGRAADEDNSIPGTEYVAKRLKNVWRHVERI